ncbi:MULTISPECIES: hypothetical protein [unclassified Ensifer]|uniref:hypothetical protein n=1 Tax=unclassified Ensifer TaxID=2633371 RepID=UPI000812E179|nr:MULTISPECIES: hypothetical protein [unclassified Ensifer]OCO99196.1 hypothetical protein BBX50_09745 [Ensifer sp. LC11]OCO99402.1 hypothetical protein BC374_09810 [Ensifer sp. LC13]OCP12850.1 hypothetical protein BC362_05560 [Ensifer sp. LC14]OCP29560.1 hypothetical protein BC364_07865 [Ensifer sp. LC499]
MSWIYFVSFAYSLTALFLLAMTYIEGLQARAPWNMYRLAGLLVCIFWPVLFLYLMVTMASKRRISQR